MPKICGPVPLSACPVCRNLTINNVYDQAKLCLCLLQATSRLKKNVAYFKINYLIVIFTAIAVCMLMNPGSLLVLCALLTAWVYVFVIRSTPLVIANHTVRYGKPPFSPFSFLMLVSLFCFVFEYKCLLQKLQNWQLVADVGFQGVVNCFQSRDPGRLGWTEWAMLPSWFARQIWTDLLAITIRLGNGPWGFDENNPVWLFTSANLSQGLFSCHLHCAMIFIGSSRWRQQHTLVHSGWRSAMTMDGFAQ